MWPLFTRAILPAARKPGHVLAVFLALAVTTACDESEPVPEVNFLHNALSCELSVAGPVEQGEPVWARLTLHNQSDVSVQVSRYFTPFEGIMGEIFVISFQDESLPYQGPMVKRGPPSDGDWLDLEANRKLSAKVDLAEGWDLARPGEYFVKFHRGLSFRLYGEIDPGNRVPYGAVCPETSFHIVGQPGAVQL